jgi:hypothetical protein
MKNNLLSNNKIVTFTIKMFKNASHVIPLKGHFVEGQQKLLRF